MACSPKRYENDNYYPFTLKKGQTSDLLALIAFLVHDTLIDSKDPCLLIGFSICYFQNCWKVMSEGHTIIYFSVEGVIFNSTELI